uniref:Uncharacterized protein n=1 Tax=Fibrocapsa japonica TaxID=94617 RepID=A0A7S2XZ66_9STRA|mmetsp:Transcript_5012/g.7605  ORF Transcript_5012/g.7605 Transcript_5012/m.7605 type:complete len:152 (+) Transcript_5012:21-476(+)
MPEVLHFPSRSEDQDGSQEKGDNARFFFSVHLPPRLDGVISEQEFAEIIKAVNNDVKNAIATIPLWLWLCPCLLCFKKMQKRHTSQAICQAMDEVLRHKEQRHFAGSSEKLRMKRIQRSNFEGNKVQVIMFSWESRDECMKRAALEIEPLA